MDDGEAVDPAIAEAISEGAKAGIFWTAARFNPGVAATWEGFGRRHSKAAAACLGAGVARLIASSSETPQDAQ